VVVAQIRADNYAAAPTWAHAVEAFLATHSRAQAWSPGTVVKYRQTLTGLAVAGMTGSPVCRTVAALGTPAGAASLQAAFTGAYGALAPATRARHLAALRSALAWWCTVGWLIGDPTTGWSRPKISRDYSRALTSEQISALWRLEVRLRDKTLWRLLYESAARAGEILGLDVGDLDPINKRARVIGKGGDTDWVYYQTGIALLLPRLLGGRTRGPVFLSDRLPARAVAGLDLCPVTGRARLSYRRAAEVFTKATTPLATAAGRGSGWTLHQLRHSALTHDAEAGTNTPNAAGPLPTRLDAFARALRPPRPRGSRPPLRGH
jgi:integrase